MTDSTPQPIHHARWSELDAATAFAIAQLRQSVFIVEQTCPYPDLDELDIAESTVHWWIEADTVYMAAATLRVMDEGDTWRIGRVATAQPYRGQGAASKLLWTVLAWIDGQHRGMPIVLDAQSYLEAWYAKFGFVVDGERFLEDGIEHTPMRASSQLTEG